MSKHAWLVLLVGVNLALLSGIFLKVSAPREARAQAIGGVMPYLIVTGKAPGGSAAAVYLLDLSSRTMFCMQPNNAGELQLLDRRDLARDFGRQDAGSGRPK